MATLAVRTISFGARNASAVTRVYAGLDMTTALDAGANAGDQFINDGLTFLRAKNTGSIKQVTVLCQRNNADGFKEDCVVSIPATTGDKTFGPFGADFTDDNGYCQIRYESSDATGITISPFRLAAKGRG
jgi:hypothetical protein